MKRIIFYTLLSALTGAPAFAQSLGSDNNLTITLATSQKRTDNTGHGNTDYRIEGVWKGAKAPLVLYFRADHAHWLKCEVAIPEKRPMPNPGDFAIAERRIKVTQIKKGNKLFISPEHAPSDVQPDEVKKMPEGALYYQLPGAPGKWKAVKVNFRKLPDLKL